MKEICLQEGEDEYLHLTALTDFALAMKDRLDEVNRHSFNNFQLRVGKLCKWNDPKWLHFA